MGLTKPVVKKTGDSEKPCSGAGFYTRWTHYLHDNGKKPTSFTLLTQLSHFIKGCDEGVEESGVQNFRISGVSIYKPVRLYNRSKPYQGLSSRLSPDQFVKEPNQGSYPDYRVNIWPKLVRV